jgi:anti-sigma B factor antagonist
MAEAQPGVSDQPVVVTLPREIDLANAPEVGQQLGAALASGATIVVAVLSATTFCDSMGVRTLVMAHKRAAASDAELRVVVSSAGVRRVMAITKVDTVLRIYRSLDTALAADPGSPSDHDR